MKKIIALFSFIVFTCGCSYAAIQPYATTDSGDITVKDTSSREFLRNQGYSDEAARLIEVRGKNPLTPIPVVEKRQNCVVKGLKKVGWRFLDTLDPTVNNKKFGEHNINYDGVTVEDL